MDKDDEVITAISVQPAEAQISAAIHAGIMRVCASMGLPPEYISGKWRKLDTHDYRDEGRNAR